MKKICFFSIIFLSIIFLSGCDVKRSNPIREVDADKILTCTTSEYDDDNEILTTQEVNFYFINDNVEIAKSVTKMDIIEENPEDTTVAAWKFAATAMNLMVRTLEIEDGVEVYSNTDKEKHIYTINLNYDFYKVDLKTLEENDFYITTKTTYNEIKAEAEAEGYICQ